VNATHAGIASPICQLIRANALEWVHGTEQHVITTTELARFFDSNNIARFLHHTQHGLVTA
jgi:hypothetical protein